MPDRETVIEGLQEAKKYLEDKEWSDKKAAPHIDWIIKAIALLKEQPVWHVFKVREPDKDEKKEHPNWKWVMESDLTPKHGEEFLWYRRSINCFVIDSWNDDMWEEYCSTADGETIEAGDAWMELPKPPEHKLNENH